MNLIFCKYNKFLYFILGFEINCKSYRKKIMRLNIIIKDKSIFKCI